MGMSADAQLFYGVLIKDENFLNEDNDWDWEKLYMSKLGFKEPDYYSEREKYEEWSDKKRKIIEELDVSIETHSYGEEPMYVVCIKTSLKTAWLGDPIRIFSLAFDYSWAEKIKKFCDIMELEINNECGWWMCSCWG